MTTVTPRPVALHGIRVHRVEVLIRCQTTVESLQSKSPGQQHCTVDGDGLGRARTSGCPTAAAALVEHRPTVPQALVTAAPGPIGRELKKVLPAT
jgi:hypothetical protein